MNCIILVWQHLIEPLPGSPIPPILPSSPFMPLGPGWPRAPTRPSLPGSPGIPIRGQIKNLIETWTNNDSRFINHIFMFKPHGLVCQTNSAINV